MIARRATQPRRMAQRGGRARGAGAASLRRHFYFTCPRPPLIRPPSQFFATVVIAYLFRSPHALSPGDSYRALATYNTHGASRTRALARAPCQQPRRTPTSLVPRLGAIHCSPSFDRFFPATCLFTASSPLPATPRPGRHRPSTCPPPSPPAPRPPRPPAPPAAAHRPPP